MSDEETQPESTEAIDEILRTARSVRRRIDFDRPVEREVIEECIGIATQAPTGIPAEIWRFLVLTEPEPKRALAGLYRQALSALAEARGGEVKTSQQQLADRLDEMPALILVCAEGRPAPDSIPLQVSFYGSILPAAWSLMLALRARGIGATWTTLHLLHEREAAAQLGIPENVTQTILLPVGYTRNAVLRPAERRPPGDITYWNRWGHPKNS
ncbi:MAG TPA: nitroreductase family protein [Myxococcales bacterium]|jgi:nitroreductase|nr:nitroreductase family protein [Myxococcales bacterium]HIL02668.1 nitroreductase family protein [Myxococcales bacterium]